MFQETRVGDVLPLARYTMELPQVKTTLPLLSTTGEVGRPVVA